MIDSTRTFTVVSDNILVDLIRGAKKRLVVISPALTDAVATAVAGRFRDLGDLTVSIVLDADPEVYRLGFGTEKALDILREASDRYMFDLRVQFGVRIGVVISDQTTMVFSPVPQLIEAGSTSTEKPNAVILSGVATEHLSDAAGAGSAEATARQEIGTRPLTPAAVQAVKQDLKANPPQPFNIARAVRVFSSKVQYIELQVTNYRFSSRQIPLPPELIDVADIELKKQISGRIHAPTGGIGKLKIPVKTADKEDTIEVDDKWLIGERKRIEDTYTYVVPNFGRVILCTDRQAFDAEIERFTENLKSYHNAVSAAFERVKTDLESRLVKEYLPKWKQHPPANFARYNLAGTEDNLEQELRIIVQNMLQRAVSFEPPSVRVIYKNIAPESVLDDDFREPLERIMLKRGVPFMKVKSLFASGDAAPASEHLYNHALKA